MLRFSENQLYVFEDADLPSRKAKHAEVDWKKGTFLILRSRQECSLGDVSGDPRFRMINFHAVFFYRGNEGGRDLNTFVKSAGAVLS